ncbi:MAG: T9SS type A sorting domain-containing protein [bacterium]|nr:T9SS type A sorting domain-containing protein [bacterium]
MGKPGDKYIVGSRPNYNVWGTITLSRDSVGEDGSHYIFIRGEDNSEGLAWKVTTEGYVYRPNPDRSFPTNSFRLCAELGSRWKLSSSNQSSDSIIFTGDEVIDVLGKDRNAKRFVTLSLYLGEWVPIFENFVIDTFGLVLTRDLNHGEESYRLLGAVINGVYHGDPRPVNVVTETTLVDSLARIDKGIFRIPNVLSDTAIQVYNLRGNLVLSTSCSTTGFVDLTSLPKGIYVVAFSGSSSSGRRFRVLVE